MGTMNGAGERRHVTIRKGSAMYHHIEIMGRERQAELQEQAAALRLARASETPRGVSHSRAWPVRLGGGMRSLMQVWARWMPRSVSH